jgi:hypothetical protein
MQFKEIMLNKSKFHRDKKKYFNDYSAYNACQRIFLDNEEVI